MNRRLELPQTLVTVDLAREADFQIGSLEICPSRRQVAVAGRYHSVQPRVMQVLVALFRAGGAVISREELIESCWDGITVGDDAINRCIAKVRQLAGFGGANAFEIETVARVGYRLMRHDPPMPDSSPPETGSQLLTVPARTVHAASRFRSWMPLAAICASAVIAGIWLFRPEHRWTVIASRPFIDTLMLERDPAFSPDGKMIAYSAGIERTVSSIYVRPMAGGDPVRTSDDPYEDLAPAWASDGGRIVYVGYTPGEPCHIIMTSVTGSPAREVGRCRFADYTTLSWQPNSAFVYYSDGVGTTSAIFRLNVESGIRERVTSVTDPIASRPQISPDGKWLLFEAFAALTAQSLRIRDLGSGAETTLGRVPSDAGSSTAWTEDSRAVLATISHGLGTEIWAWPIDGSNPYRVYATATNIGRIAAGPHGLLAVQVEADRTNLARAGGAPMTTADVIDIANGHTWSPSFAPDGSLAFISNRSGENAIWIMKPGAPPAQLFNGGTAALDRLRWSPDGTKLAFIVGTDTGVIIRVITTEGMPIALFDMISIGYGMPTWTPDSKALISFDRRALRAVRTDLNNPSRHVPLFGQLWDGITIRSNGTFAIRADVPGIWQIDRGIRLITSKYPQAQDPALVVRGGDILIPEFDSKPSRLIAQPITGGATQLTAYAPLAVDDSDFAINPKNGEIIYSAKTANDINIDLLTVGNGS